MTAISKRSPLHACITPAALSLVFLLAACSGGGGGGSAAQSSTAADVTPAAVPADAAVATAPVPVPVAAAASVLRAVDVPQALRTDPFNVDRTLTVPPGFGIRVWARVNKARFMAIAPNGDVLVSVPSENKIVLLRERPNDVPQSFDFATGLDQPHDMVFRQIGQTTYLYIAETGRVIRVAYAAGDTRASAPEVIIDGLPDGSLPELRGNYGHELKNIAFGADNRLYLSIASACNACAEDTTAEPVRGSIYQYNAEGKEGRLFARGLRNAEGLDFLPGTNTLWVAVNNRDEVKYPFDNDIDGDRVSDLGEIIPSYVDLNPPEPFTSVRDGGNYGWPFCNSVPNDTMSNLDTVRDYDLNRDGAKLDCATVDRASKGIRAHSAPLGFSFLHASGVPAAYRSGAVVAQHGCWNCTTLDAGYRVSYFPFDGAGNAGTEINLVTGFVTDARARALWGRPVDAIADAKGNILISDDYANAIYQLYPL